MSKGSAALGVIALVLAAGGLGLGGLAWIETQAVSSSNPISWFKYNGTAFYINPVVTYLTFHGLKIEFELGPDESVSFSFSSKAHVEAVAGWSRISVYFRVDDITKLTLSAQVGMYNGGFTNHYSVHLQDVRNDLLPGVHTVTVVIIGTYSANYIWESSLFVQKVSNVE